MKKKNEKNPEIIELKQKKEENKNKDFDMSNNISSYFQTIDLKELSSYKGQISKEINNTDTLFGNNYFKYFMKNKLLPNKKNCFGERPRKLGNLYTFLFIKNQPLFVIGTKKISLVLIYQLCLHLSFILIHLNIIHSVFPYMKYMLTVFYLMNFLNHMYIVLINPGIPSPQNYSKNCLKIIKEEDKKYFEVCEICNIIVDCSDDVRHCTECNICVKQLDHHCYWTGKCIAKNNYFTFQMFTFTTLLYYVWYGIVFVVWAIIKMSKAKKTI